MIGETCFGHIAPSDQALGMLSFPRPFCVAIFLSFQRNRARRASDILRLLFLTAALPGRILPDASKASMLIPMPKGTLMRRSIARVPFRRGVAFFRLALLLAVERAMGCRPTLFCRLDSIARLACATLLLAAVLAPSAAADPYQVLHKFDGDGSTEMGANLSGNLVAIGSVLFGTTHGGGKRLSGNELWKNKGFVATAFGFKNNSCRN